MKKDTLIWKIVNALHDNETLDVKNFETYVEQANAIHDVIEKELETYVLIKGNVVE